MTIPTKRGALMHNDELRAAAIRDTRPDLMRTKTPLTVVSVAYPLAPVTEDPVGGAEQVLLQIHRALRAAGHRSIVIANDRSSLSGELVSFSEPSSYGSGALDIAESRARGVLAAVMDREPV